MSASVWLAARRPRNSGILDERSATRSGKLIAASPVASAAGSACAHSVLLPAPRQTTMSPAATTRLRSGATSRSLATTATCLWPLARIASASVALLTPSMGASPAV